MGDTRGTGDGIFEYFSNCFRVVRLGVHLGEYLYTWSTLSEKFPRGWVADHSTMIYDYHIVVPLGTLAYRY